MWLYDKIKKSYEKRVDATGLALFRILYGIVLFFEIRLIYFYRHLIFDRIPYLVPYEIDFSYPLIIWMGVALLIAFGKYTRIATLLNFTLSLVFIGTISTYEYHMFYIYQGINLLLMFLPVSQVMSLDRLSLKLKHSTLKNTYTPPTKVTQWAYFTPILMALAFVYLDSVFYKFSSPLWKNGLGMWLPSSLPMITHSDTTFLMNQRWLVMSLGYLTMVFELLFIFLFWFKWARIPLFVIGIGLHLGILLEFPIPLFAIGVIGIYFLLLPVKYWKKISGFFEAKTPSLTFYYDEENLFHVRGKIIVDSLNIFKRIQCLGIQTHAKKDPILGKVKGNKLLNEVQVVTKGGKHFSGFDAYLKAFGQGAFFILAWILAIPGIKHLGKWLYSKFTSKNKGTSYLQSIPPVPLSSKNRKIFSNLSVQDIKVPILALMICLIVGMQAIVTMGSFLSITRTQANAEDQTRQRLYKSYLDVHKHSKPIFGITNHALFMDYHFNNYNHNLALTYEKDGKETFLPIVNEDGSMGDLVSGFIWAKWGFRVNSAYINPNTLQRGIRDFTAFWAHHNNVDLNKAKFNVKVKLVENTTKWQKDFYRKQQARPWLDGGYVLWENRNMKSFIKDIEQIGVAK